MHHIAAGGLGGGGDVGLALSLLEAAHADLGRTVIASFLKCNVDTDRLGDLALAGSLIRIPTGYFPSRRVFEDKIPLVEPRLEDRIYGICVKHDWKTLTEAIDKLADTYTIKQIHSSDIGGDSLILGYEEKLGSYKVDTAAKAVLAYASRELGVKTLITVAAVGAEGGGAELDHEWLAAILLYLDSLGAVKGALPLEVHHLTIARKLLRYGDSGMLSFLVKSTGKPGKARICNAYLCGEYEVKPWYRTVYLLDPEALCDASPLCRSAYGRGWHGLRTRPKTRPPRELVKMYKEARQAGSRIIFERIARKKRITLHALKGLPKNKP